MLRILTSNGQIIRGWANLSRVRGVIAGRTQGGYVLQQHPGQEIFIETKDETTFRDFAKDTPIAKDQINILEGDYVDAIGEQTSEGLHATLLSYSQPVKMQPNVEQNMQNKAVATKKGASPFVICTYTYYGIASWYNCPDPITGSKGRCGTCSTSQTYQLAWPAMDTCGCCTSSCDDCSKNCMNQIYLSCGNGVIVTDLCGNRNGTFAIVDAGPCQEANCGGCTPQLCGRVCSDCLGYNTTLVDLTKKSFAVWYDPAGRGCFSCKVEYMGPC